MSAPVFTYDIFLSHGAKDKTVVSPLAEWLRKEGLKVWFDEWLLAIRDSVEPPRQRAKIEEGLEHSRVLIPCVSAIALGSDWEQLEASTCGRGDPPFRDPLNQERRFIALRLDEAPI